MSQVISNRTAILIVIILSSALIIQFTSNQIEWEDSADTQAFKDIVFGVNTSLFAIVFLILGIKKINTYLLAAFGGLVTGIFPIVSSLKLFLNPITDLAVWYVLFVLGIVGWFLIVIVCFEKANNKKLVENALPHIKTIFTILVMLAIWAYAVYILVINGML